MKMCKSGSCRSDHKKKRKAPRSQSQAVKQQCVELILLSGNTECLEVKARECDAAALQFSLTELGVMHCLPATC